jgi:tRNA (guanine-N7-)-methyltransferase
LLSTSQLFNWKSATSKIGQLSFTTYRVKSRLKVSSKKANGLVVSPHPISIYCSDSLENMNADPKTGRPSLLYPLTTVVERLDLAQLFPSAQPLEVELGSGDGGFIMEYARAHPEKNFIAIERLLGRARKIGRKGARLPISNLQVIRLEASYVLKYLLSPGSAQALHIYFPDPWPKRRHADRRLVNGTLAEIASRALAPGGKIFLRTDNADYYAQMLKVFTSNPAYRPIEVPAELKSLLTDFERDFQAAGVPTLYAAYELARQ